MTKLAKTISRLHPQVRRHVAETIRFGQPFYSDDQNRQMLIYYEAFRQIAEAMLSDGGPEITAEMMDAVIKEMQARRADDGGTSQQPDPRLDLEATGWFMEM